MNTRGIYGFILACAFSWVHYVQSMNWRDVINYSMAGGMGTYVLNKYIFEKPHVAFCSLFALDAGASLCFDVIKFLRDPMLKRAARDGNYLNARLALLFGADVHKDDNKALGTALAYGHEHIVRLLLTSGADVNAPHIPEFAARSGKVGLIR